MLNYVNLLQDYVTVAYPRGVTFVQ